MLVRHHDGHQHRPVRTASDNSLHVWAGPLSNGMPASGDVLGNGDPVAGSASLDSKGWLGGNTLENGVTARVYAIGSELFVPTRRRPRG